MDEQHAGMFEQGDHTPEKERERGNLTDTNESRQVYAQVGDRLQEMAGNAEQDSEKRGTGEAPPNENLIAERFDTISETPGSTRDTRNLGGGIAPGNQPEEVTDEQPLVPDNAFSRGETPTGTTQITSMSPGPGNETAPYQGETQTMPFTEGDENRGWTSGQGEDSGAKEPEDTTTGERTGLLTK